MIYIFSDPHLGLNRTEHTTPESRARLRQTLFNQAKYCIDLSSRKRVGNAITICLGDLFDQYWSDATTLSQGLNIMQGLNFCLLGNHDYSNRGNAKGAMEFLLELGGKKVDPTTVGFGIDNVSSELLFVAVHHKVSQELFEETLRQALEKVQDRKEKKAVLLLHCNYNSPFATDSASLNLSREFAEQLLQSFDLILIGHEHNHREDFGGRLKVLGNTHPTSFADISDKFLWELDPDTLNMTAVKIWDKRGHVKVDYSELLSGYAPFPVDQFIEVVGEAKAEDMPAVAKAIADLWKTSQAFMVKNSVTCNRISVSEEVTAQFKSSDLVTKISQELLGSELESTWEQYKHLAG